VLRVGDEQWCARRLVARIHARQRDRERARYQPVTTQHFMRFLLRWQHVSAETRLSGVHGLAEVIGQLQGLEAPIGAFEESILPARVRGYQAHLLDELAAHGELAWGRLSPRPEVEGEARRAAAVPSRATPVTLARRGDLDWLLSAVRGDVSLPDPGPGPAADVLEALRERGALFFADLCELTGRLPTEVAEGLWDGVARGRVTSDGFGAVRALLSGRYRDVRQRPGAASLRRGWWRAGSPGSGRFAAADLTAAAGRLPGAGVAGATGARRPVPVRGLRPALAGGRWSVLEWAPASAFEREDLAEAVAMQLLSRWGVIFRDLAVREPWSVPWRDVLFALRRLEARGVVRGGRFVSGVSGEQYALPEALDALRRVASSPLDGEEVRLSAADPLNLTGVLLPGPRLPALRGGVLLLVDGVPPPAEAARDDGRRRSRARAHAG
jgi:ATP-dependent Lhr-like helicase